MNVPDLTKFKTAAAFRMAVETHLRAQATLLGPKATVNNLRRRFLQERFLARVFTTADATWALKGGVGMLVRVPHLARYSRDIDLVHLPANPDQAAEELARIGQLDLGDFLRFQAGPRQRLSTDDALRITVDAYAGTALWDKFPVDVSCELHYVGELERHNHKPVLPTDKLELPLPEFVLYPAVDQIADKVAAMYERHGESASNRWRDLADLVLLVGLEDLEADRLTQALPTRAERARNPVTLPETMRSPASEWETGYPKYAAHETLIPAQYHDLDEALRYVGECLDPILSGRVTTGRWNPYDRRWVSP